VIISDAVGVADQIQDIPGVTVVPRLPANWIRAIDRQLSDPEKPPREPVVNRFSTERVAELMINAYEMCL
jgi:hypothetical protein